jgi:hypothetical protein
MKNHEQNIKVKKSEKPRFYGQNKLFLEHPVLLPLDSFSHMATCRSSSKNTWKMSLIPVFNKNLPRAHMESEFDVLAVHKKLVKYVVHLSKRKNWKKIKILHTRWTKICHGLIWSRNWRAWCSPKACEIRSSLV